MFANGSGLNELPLQGASSSINASYKVSVQLADRIQKRRILKNQPIRNKNRLQRPSFLIDPEEMSNRDRELPIYASYQVSVHLAKRCRI
jgi:hypothetical protein